MRRWCWAAAIAIAIACGGQGRDHGGGRDPGPAVDGPGGPGGGDAPPEVPPPSPPPEDPPPADPPPAEPPPPPPAPPPRGSGGTTGPLEVVFRESSVRFLAVGADGTAYGQGRDDAPWQLSASADGRTWAPRGEHAGGRGFFVMAALESGTLLADTTGPEGHALSRSADGGRTWAVVLPLGRYRMLTPGNVAELGREVFLLEYQSFTGDDAPIRLWVSGDDGRTWKIRFQTAAHRHGHGLLADPSAGALWLFYGDRTGGTYLSLDAGRTMTLVRPPLEGGVLVDAVPTPDGILGALDAPFQPLFPDVVAIGFGGSYERRARLPGPSYSFHALRGWYLASAAHEPVGDVYPAGDVAAHLLASEDGRTFREVFACDRLDPAAAVRADVYFQLPTGEPVVQVVNCAGFGPDGAGYALLAPPP